VRSQLLRSQIAAELNRKWPTSLQHQVLIGLWRSRAQRPLSLISLSDLWVKMQLRTLRHLTSYESSDSTACSSATEHSLQQRWPRLLHDDVQRRGNCLADSAAGSTSPLRKRWRTARLLGLAQEAQSDRDGLNIFNVAGRAAALAAFSISDVQKEGPLRCGLHSGPSYAHNRVSSDRRDR